LATAPLTCSRGSEPRADPLRDLRDAHRDGNGKPRLHRRFPLRTAARV